MRGLWNCVKRSDGQVPYYTTVRSGAHSYDYAGVAAFELIEEWDFRFVVCSLSAKDSRKRKDVRLRYSSRILMRMSEISR